MGFAGINRRLAIMFALALLPVEALAFFGLLTVPLDVGYPAGTSPWLIDYGIASLYVHYPVLEAMEHWQIESWPGNTFYMICFVVGYADLFLILVVVAFCYRQAKRLASSL
jgi:hypothetical protein